MFSYADIARLDEPLCSLANSQIAPESIAVAGGHACRAWPGSWINRADGVGFHGPVTADEIARLTDYYHSVGLDALVKVNPYAHESLHANLAAAGYTTKRFENLLFRSLDAVHAAVAPHPLPADIQICAIDRGDTAAVREAATLCVNVFATPERPALTADIELSIRAIQRTDCISLAAYSADGTCIASCGVEWLGPLATLYGAVVHPDFRRRGIQQTLIAHRLTLAADRGLTVATIGCTPGIPTERNARALGFQLAYTRSVMI
ncbi:MAG: GNAT family N-acetyltransferase, partial [Phycisphaerales bacterium]